VTVRHFEIILADAGSFILVVMTSDENVKNRLIKLPLHVTEQDLKLLSAVLNASLTGLPASGFTPEVMNRVTRSAGAAASLVPVSSSILRRMCSRRLIARKFTLPGRTACWASRNIRT